MARACIAIGVSLGVVLTLLERALPKYRRWLPSPSGIGLGFILPFYSPFAMFLGALIAEIGKRLNAERAERYTVPIASGIIAGESISHRRGVEQVRPHLRGDSQEGGKTGRLTSPKP